MKNKKRLQGLLRLLTIILCTSILLVSVSAEESNVEIIDYNDYATYSISETAGFWDVTAAFPFDQAATAVYTPFDYDIFSGERVDLDFPYLENKPGLGFFITPLGKMPIEVIGGIGINYDNIRILDPSLIPSSADLTFSFDIQLQGSISNLSLSSIGSVRFYVLFFEPNLYEKGYYEAVYSDDWYAEVSIEDDLTSVISITSRFKLSEYPEHAGKPFAPVILVDGFTAYTASYVNEYGEYYTRMSLLYDSFDMKFPVSDAVKVAQDSSRGDKLLGNIEQALADQGKQLDDFLNNDIELDQGEVGGAVGDLDSAEDELLDKVGGYLGEAGGLISSVISDLTQFAPAFAAVALVFNEFVSIPFISFLLRISIMLGLLAVALNMSISAERAGYWVKGKKAEEHRKNNPIGFKYDK